MRLKDKQWYVDTKDNVVQVLDLGDEFTVPGDWVFFNRSGLLTQNNEENMYGHIYREATTTEAVNGIEKIVVSTAILEDIVDTLSYQVKHASADVVSIKKKQLEDIVFILNTLLIDRGLGETATVSS